MKKISVVIPFFQHEKGILLRAIESIKNQTIPAEIEVLLIDDSSPLPANEELKNFQPPENMTIKILRQANGGPGEARNYGLDSAALDSDYIAFLDSDDSWTDNHLKNAIAALDEDFDFYFSNFSEPGSAEDQFSLKHHFSPAEHSYLERGSNCYKFCSNMLDQIIVENVIETSTVVFRKSTLGDIRFQTNFRNAFEDHLFWIEATTKSREICFSNNIECKYGYGINIYRSTSLGNDRLLPRLIDQTRFRQQVKKLAQSPSHNTALLERKRETRHAFVAEILHRLRRGKAIPIIYVLRYLKLDPGIVLTFIPIALKIYAKDYKATGN